MTEIMVQQANIAAADYENHERNGAESPANGTTSEISTAAVANSIGMGGSGLERGGGERGFISGMRERQDSTRRRSMLDRLRRRLSRGISGSSDTEYGYTTQTTSNASAAANGSAIDQPNSSLISSVTTTTNDMQSNDAGAGSDSENLIRRKSSGTRKVSDVLFRRRFYTSGQTDLNSSRANKTKQQQEQHLLNIQEQAATLGSSSQIRRVQSDSNLTQSATPARICGVCQKNSAADPKTGLKLKSFGGEVCSDCLRQHVDQKVLAGEAYHMLPPPQLSSSNLLKSSADVANLGVDVREIEKFCEPEILDRYLLLNTVKRGELYPNFVCCCTPGCGSRVSLNQASLLDQQTVRFYAKCLQCSAEYCPKCKIPKYMHLKTSDCKAARAIYERHINSASLKTKYCPKCGHANDKTNSAQIECSNCHGKYCWFCSRDLANDEYLLHFTQGPCKGRLGSKQPNITPHHLESTFLLAGVGLVMLASTPLLLVGMPVYVAARVGHKAWKKRQQIRRGESVGESGGGGDAAAVAALENDIESVVPRVPQSADEHRKSVASPANVVDELIREEPEAEQQQVVTAEHEKITQVEVK